MRDYIEKSNNYDVVYVFTAVTYLSICINVNHYFDIVSVSIKTPVISDHVTPMEQLPINNNGGQGYGFILYQTELSSVPKEIEMEQVLDRAQVLSIL